MTTPRTGRLVAAVTIAAVILGINATVVSAAPPVYDSGTFSTSATYYLDLDHGHHPTNGDLADGWYQFDRDGHRLFTSVRADVVLHGTSMPTYKQCKSAMGGGSWDMNQYLGNWFCALTNKGHVDRFKVISATDAQLVLKFTTWS